MPRSILGDELLSHRFHLLDVDWSMSFPPFVLWPAAGFNSITMPELTVETEDVIEGTSDFTHHVIKKGSVGPITLSRGSTMYNSDFWRWTMACLKGNPTQQNVLSAMLNTAAAVGTFGIVGGTPLPAKRRNMILIHLSGLSYDGLLETMRSAQGLDRVLAASLIPTSFIGTQLSESLGYVTGGFFDLGITSIPAKVWMLFGCLPSRYKPGSDFDAATSAVSIQEMEIQCDRFEEFSLLA